MERTTQHTHHISLAQPTAQHEGVTYGLCLCQTRVMELTTQGRTIVIERADNRTDDLFNRALSLGYTEESAARLADCWVNYDLVPDACTIHPNHSTSIRGGYSVDGCEACTVLILTHDAGYTLAGELARQAQAQAEQNAAQGRWLASMATDTDYIGRRVSSCGSFALGDTVTGPDGATGVVAYLGSDVDGGMEVQYPTGNTLSVGSDHFDEWSLVRTDDAPALDCYQEAMAEAERDDAGAQYAARRAAEAIECNGDESVRALETEGPSGIDTLRELLTIPTVKARKAAKPKAPKAMHGNDLGTDFTGSCGRKVSADQMTTDPAKVTCSLCKGTRRFRNWVARLAAQAWDADVTRAGLRTGLVVRQITTGHLGVITSLAGVIQVSFWAAGHLGGVYRTVGAFDQACEFVLADKLAPVGTRLVSGSGGEGVVREVTSGLITARIDSDGSARVWTLSEFAADLSRGWLAVIPTVKSQPVPTAVYVRPDGKRQSVTVADMAQVGMKVVFGYGSANNGTVTALSPHAVTVVREDGTAYIWTLTEMVRELNRANVSTFMPDANGRPIGSWR